MLVMNGKVKNSISLSTYIFCGLVDAVTEDTTYQPALGPRAYQAEAATVNNPDDGGVAYA